MRPNASSPARRQKSNSVSLGPKSLIVAGLFLAVAGTTATLTVEATGTAPTIIIVQPEVLAVAQGSTAYCYVNASGTLPLSYQWRLDGVDVPGATNPALSIANVQLTNAGSYTLFVTNLAGAATSQVIPLSVAQGWVHTNALGARLPYRLFVPRNYDAARKYPLVVFWHGAGSVGTDNSSQLSDSGQFVFLSASNVMKYPCFYLLPQLPRSPQSCEEAIGLEDHAVELLGLLQTQFSIDADRLYLTGLSLGGMATWDLIARHPDLFAAAVPMSAGLPCGSIHMGIRVPVWNFHAANDWSVNVAYSDDAVWSLRGAGGSVVYTRYQAGGHGIWPEAYRTPALVDWVMARKRGVAPTNEPLLSITGPTGEAVWTTAATRLNLAGSAGAFGRSISRVSWTNLANGANGIASGTKAWSATGVPLQPDKTNLIVVTATTTSWNDSFGGNTTFNGTITVVQAPIRATLTLQDKGAILNWHGGAPPYCVQRATDLAAGAWTDLLTNAVPPMTLPLEGQASFYRIVGQ